MTSRIPLPALYLLLLLAASLAGRADDWPPVLDAKNTLTQAKDGRVVDRYTHGERPSWGYPDSYKGEWGYPKAQETGVLEQNHNSFYVLQPKQPRENAPLFVVLHSANRTAYDYLGFEILGTKPDAVGLPGSAITNPPDDFYALYLNSTNKEWWGSSELRQSPDYKKGINSPPPADRRVMDTIEWVVKRYHIDQNRIYLCGCSMGGCGTLGIGMPHGDVFASILACVPAGTDYASARMGRFAPSPAWNASEPERAAWMLRAAGVSLPDPPVTLDFSSEADTWSCTQPALLTAAQAGRLPLVLTWGMFGHVSSPNVIGSAPICQVGLAYPWLEIRKNEAYPVFTHASCDQTSPWLNTPVEYDGAGQINGFFRWKSEQDTPSNLAMQIWIAHPNAPGAPMPQNATADVTLRRLQQFKVRQGGTYTWQLTPNGKSALSGTVTPDAANLLTIPQLPLSTTPVELSMKAN